MLTKTDLLQIRQVVKEEVKTQLDPVAGDVSSLKKDMKSVKSKLRQLNRTVNVLVVKTDREETLLKRRVDRLEKHAGIAHP